MNSQPLRPAEYYLLLSLYGNESTKYGIRGTVYNISLKGINLDTTQLNRIINKFESEALIELIQVEKPDDRRQAKNVYGLTEHGKILLQAETHRLNHALKVAENAGVMDNTTPTDVQRMLISTNK